jgi:hypothetical protein
MLKKISGLAVVASLLSCSALTSLAHAEAAAPTLKISGNTVMNMYAFEQKRKVNKRKNGFHLANDLSDLVFVIAGKAAAGWEYKYKISMEALANQKLNVQQNYVEFDSCMGVLQIGNVVGPEDSMIEDGGAVVGATGAFDGAYHNVFNLAAFAMRGNDNIGDTGYSTKIVYYTPAIGDFRLGLAFTPNTAHSGDAEYDRLFGNGNENRPGNRTWLPIKDENPFGTDSIAVGLSYKREFGNWGLNLNGAYIHDNSYIPADTDDASENRTRVKDVNAYQLGMVLGYRTHAGGLVQLGAGWLDNGKSRLLKRTITVENDPLNNQNTFFNGLRRGNNGQAWNVALGYTLGAYKAALSYQRSDRKVHGGARVNDQGAVLENFGGTRKVKNQVISATFDVVPVQGLKFYGEVDYIESRSSRNLQNAAHAILDANNKANVRVARTNKGTVFIMGTKVSF